MLGKIEFKIKNIGDIRVGKHSELELVVRLALRISKESTRGNVVRICREIYVDQGDFKIGAANHPSRSE